MFAVFDRATTCLVSSSEMQAKLTIKDLRELTICHKKPIYIEYSGKCNMRNTQ